MKSSRRRIVLLGLALTCLSSLSLSACSPGPTTIRMEQAELQPRFESAFPVEITKYLTKIRLTNPRLILRPGSEKLGAAVKVSVQPPLLNATFTGEVVAFGRLEYAADEKAFYLRDAEVESLRIDDIPDAQNEAVRAAVEAIVGSTLSRFPVYAFKDRNMKEVAASFVLQKVYVKDGALFAQLGPPLAQ